MTTKLQPATLDANDETYGPMLVQAGRVGVFSAEVTGTITLTIQCRIGGSTYIDVSDGEFTSSFIKHLLGPGDYIIKASSVSGGSAVCRGTVS